MWTLYKDFQPDLEEQPDWAEYYQLRLIPEENRSVYKVEEYHGWFNDSEKRAAHHIRILAPEEGFKTWGKALEAVRHQILHLAELGFIHQLTFDPFALRHYEHILIDVEGLRG